MARQLLSLETLPLFDYGKAGAAVELALATVVRDCVDRPGVKAARCVSLVISVTPVLLQDGDVVDANVSFKVSPKTPPYETPARPVAVTKKGQLYFEELSPDNPRQSTID